VARVLQVCNTDFYLSRFLTPLVMELAARGHSVECVCEGRAIDERVIARSILTHDFKFPRRGSLSGFWSAIQRMRGILRQGKYDCVDSHNRNASLVARVAAYLEDVPVNLYTAHGFYFHDGQPGWLRELTVLLESALARITDFTLSQSAEDVAFVVKRGLIKPDRIAHIGNGIDFRRFGARLDRNAAEAQLALGPSSFRITTTGRIVRGKGFEDLLSAFGRLRRSVPDSQLVMIGGNIAQDVEPFQREFEARIEAAGLGSSVRITGIVGNVEEYLSAADVFVLPSYREGLPRSLIEAMVIGVPCIATDIRGCREIISDRDTGFLYPAGDVDELLNLLLRYFEKPDERAQMAARGRAAATRDYDERNYVSKQVAIIERLVSETSLTRSR
jgi:glycosyltransferase involved in cell wall biosynthesis